jgi:hypothetical protein
MIDNLRVTDRNQEQDWLATNLAKFAHAAGAARSVTVGQLLLSELAPSSARRRHGTSC